MRRLENRITRMETAHNDKAGTSPVVIFDPETGEPLDPAAAAAAEREHQAVIWLPCNGRQPDLHSPTRSNRHG